ncbi:MAG: FHA domain-containing protein [Anaerolineaceae bacterium]|nr:FHA domain-containing protein [Anaerolineaceae bacterium]
MKKYHVFILSLLTITGFIFPVQAQSVGRVEILNADAAAFPTVRFTARVLDSFGQAISGLSPSNFLISENYNDNLSVQQLDGNIDTVFIILSQPISIGEKRLYTDIINTYSNLVYRSGDSLAYIFTSGSQVNPASTPNEVIQAINSHNFSTDGTLSAAIDRAMAYLLPMSQQNRQVQAVLIGSYFNSNITNTYTDIPLHVLHAHTGTRSQYETRFRTLANGQFLSVQGLDAGLNNFLSQLNENRAIYAVTYTSRTAQEGVRSIQVTVQTGTETMVGLFNYQADVLPVQLTILGNESNSSAINRIAQLMATPSATSDAQYEFDKNSETITVSYSFPDNRTRSIDQAWLIINGVEQPSIIPALNGNTFEIQWDLTGYNQSQTIGVAVSITDYFNLRSTSATQQYEIVVPEFVAPTVEINPCINLDGTVKNTAECAVSTNAGVTLLVLVVQIVVVVGLVVSVLWQRRRIGQLATGAGHALSTITSGAAATALEVGRKTSIAFTNFMSGRSTTIEDSDDRMPGTSYEEPNAGPHSRFSPASQANRETKIEGSLSGETLIEGGITVPPNALAIFVIEKGHAVAGKTIIMPNTMTGLTFGREESFGVDTQGMILMEGVSRLHCTVNFNAHRREFSIEDKGSANGTYVEDRRLGREMPEPLSPNALIQLGKNFAMRFIPNPTLFDQPAPTPVQNPVPSRSQVQLIDNYEYDDSKSNPKLPIIEPPANNKNNQKPRSDKEEEGDPWID